MTILGHTGKYRIGYEKQNQYLATFCVQDSKIFKKEKKKNLIHFVYLFIIRFVMTLIH